MSRITRRTLIGAGVSVAAVGAVRYGFWPRMDGYRDEVAIGTGPEPRIDIALSPAREQRGALYQAIPLRQSTRSVYDGQPVAPDWIGATLFRSFFTKQAENQKYTDHIRSSAGIAVFVADHDDPKHWIKVGRGFECFALQATALGVRNAHLNMPVEVLSVRPEFASWLGLPGVRPNLVIRFGRAPALPMSLRRPVAKVLV